VIFWWNSDHKFVGTSRKKFRFLKLCLNKKVQKILQFPTMPCSKMPYILSFNKNVEKFFRCTWPTLSPHHTFHTYQLQYEYKTQLQITIFTYLTFMPLTTRAFSNSFLVSSSFFPRKTKCLILKKFFSAWTNFQQLFLMVFNLKIL